MSFLLPICDGTSKWLVTSIAFRFTFALIGTGTDSCPAFASMEAPQCLYICFSFFSFLFLSHSHAVCQESQLYPSYTRSNKALLTLDLIKALLDLPGQNWSDALVNLVSVGRQCNSRSFSILLSKNYKSYQMILKYKSLVEICNLTLQSKYV